MADHNQMIEEFLSITGHACDEARAQFYLESSGWQLQVAIASFFDNETGDMDDTPDTLPQDTRREPAPQPQPAAVPKAKSGKSAGSSRFATLSDMQQGEESDSSEEEGQAFYAGGSERGGSGQQIVGPGRKKKSDKIVDEIFKTAKEHGAQEVEAGTPVPSSSRPGGTVFRGAGYRLGDTEGGEAVPVPGTAGSLQPKPKDMNVVLKLYKNGFTVNDQELRSFKDPKNAEFLNSVTNGEIPRELIRLAKGGQVNMDMEDHRDQEYMPPKPMLTPFAGAGHKLGSPTPNIVSNPVPAASSAQASAPSTSVQLDESQPCTSLQIRMADGSRLVPKFNHTHTIGDIRRYIVESRPQYASQTFVLMTTFPNKELTNESESLVDANLLNAVIVQRLK
ncbi:NSFL1 cofactor p47-like [Ptychodera flava]|uniref:NSFL1 cofactor p47-like n=1 Tax=Ptychodera flava TaxID=63121 RepID=UPI00396A27C9